MSVITVLNQRGTRARDAILDAVPGAAVVDVPGDGPLPDGVRGDALLASTTARNLAEASARVSWVHLPSTGINWVPAEVFERCEVTCSRGVTSAAIAEFAVAAMLAFEKRLPEVWVAEPPTRWSVATIGTLVGRHVAIVGIGTIGQAIARRLLPFGCEIRAYRRHPDRPSAVDGVTIERQLDRLLPWADHLVLAAPATAWTHHLLGRAQLARLRRGVHLVNVARGALLDQDALGSALDDGTVATASLDVCTPEPLPAGHWLYSHPKVRLSPHVSWRGVEADDGVADLFIANLRRRLDGAPLHDVVDPEEGY